MIRGKIVTQSATSKQASRLQRQESRARCRPLPDAAPSRSNLAARYVIFDCIFGWTFQLPAKAHKQARRGGGCDVAKFHGSDGKCQQVPASAKGGMSAHDRVAVSLRLAGLFFGALLLLLWFAQLQRFTKQEVPPCCPGGTAAELAAAKRAFLEKYGQNYGYRGTIDALWEREVGPRLPKGAYLDYTATGLYWNSQLRASMKELEGAVYGNPHSVNPSAQRTDEAVEAVRARVLAMLGADPAEYELVFTRSGTEALRLLGEAFPWSNSSRFAYTTANHNSVLGIREYASQHGAAHGVVSEEEVETWVAGGSNGSGGGGNGRSLLPLPERADGAAATETTERSAAGMRRRLAAEQRLPAHASVLGEAGARMDGEGTAMPDVGEEDKEAPTFNLFAFPAYCNFAGTMHPLRWVRQVQAQSRRHQRWAVLLDAAAYVPTHPLNLTAVPADFVILSFYKLFGYPTGVGAWVVRREWLQIDRKVYWGGGSVFLATAGLDWRLLQPPVSARYQDGTPPFLDILALRHGLDVLASLGWQPAIERHVSALREWLFGQLSSLRHSNGAPLLRIFGRHDRNDSREVQGATFNFLILRPDGQPYSYRTAALEMSEAGLHTRCGCTCNPGACYGFLGLRDEEVRVAAQQAKGNFSHWEWVWVQRATTDRRQGGLPAPSMVPSAPNSGSSNRGGDASGSSGGRASSGGALHWVRLPLGSLRVSLGFMSRFEDGYALLCFLRTRYIDRAPSPADEGSNSEARVSAADCAAEP